MSPELSIAVHLLQISTMCESQKIHLCMIVITDFCMFIYTHVQKAELMTRHFQLLTVCERRL